MPWQQGPNDPADVVIPEGETAATVFIGNPSEMGLVVPALGTATTVTLKVGFESDGSDAVGIVDQAGTAKLALASGSGGVAISSLELGAVLGYPFLTIVLGAAQAADVTFVLGRKAVSVTG